MDKRVFKICEAVALGLDCYYMGKKDRHKLTKADRTEAGAILPTLPKGWMQLPQEWQVFGTTSKPRKKKRSA